MSQVVATRLAVPHQKELDPLFWLFLFFRLFLFSWLSHHMSCPYIGSTIFVLHACLKTCDELLFRLGTESSEAALTPEIAERMNR